MSVLHGKDRLLFQLVVLAGAAEKILDPGRKIMIMRGRR